MIYLIAGFMYLVLFIVYLIVTFRPTGAHKIAKEVATEFLKAARKRFYY